MRREKHRISEKVKETINFNKDLMESPLIEKNYYEFNWFLIESHLKEFYGKILRIIDQLPNNNYYLYKNKSVVEFDFEKLTSLPSSNNEKEDSREYVKNLLHQLTEIGLLNKVSYENLFKESLNNNHLYSVSLMRRNEPHENFFIIKKLDQEQLSSIYQGLKTKIDSLRKSIKTKEKPQEKSLHNSDSRDVRTKEEFYNTLDYLQGKISHLNQFDEGNEKYRGFIKNEMDYTYSLLISQCKLHKEIDLSIKIGRPAFLWRLDQLKIKFKRMHAFKDVSFYLQKIDYLVNLGAIKRISFNQIESELLQFIDEKEIKKKPDLYIFPEINSSMLLRIAEFKPRGFKRDRSSSFGGESAMEILDSQQKGGLKNVEKDESSYPYDSNDLEVEKEIEDKYKDEIVSELNVEVAERHKERVEYNLDKIYSDFFEEIYKPINQYLVENDLKIFYTEILKQVLRTDNNLLEYKNNPIFYIDGRTLVQIYNVVFPRWVTSDEASKLYNSLIELGLFDEVSSQTVAINLKLTTQGLGNEIRNRYSKGFKDDSNLYILNRLNESVLKRIFYKIKSLSESNESKLKSVNTDVENQERRIEKTEESDSKLKNTITEIDYSITESALEILIESKIEGNKVIIDKFSFDNLIRAILGEVPGI